MARRAGVFATLEENFFSPLASPNREHYAALLVLFYRLFQENSHGLEREYVVSRFMEYLAGVSSSLEEEDEEDEEESQAAIDPLRSGASRTLRKLIQCGWMNEEILPDYTRIINISPQGKPFFEALAKVEEGLRTEYESHVVAVYSLLCTDAAAENGHYAVLNAHNATMALIDSLKVLSQSIKHHYECFIATAGEGKIGDLLHLHYDLYANDILDSAYKRLKTSDNLSRYRPKILRRVGAFLRDASWLESSGQKLARMGALSATEARTRLENMLEEIRDTLKAVDPLLEDIDRRNMMYARSSIERVKALLEPDSTIAGKLAALAKEIIAARTLHLKFSHRIYHLRHLASESLYRRWLRETIAPERTSIPLADRKELDRVEAELRLRLEKQLGPAKIRAWLDSQGGTERILKADTLVQDMDSFIRLLYAVLYADSPSRRFEYMIEEAGPDFKEGGGFMVPDLAFRRKR